MEKQFVSIVLFILQELSHNVCLSTDKTVSEDKQYSFYLDSILVEHPNNLLSPIPLSSAAFKGFAKNEIFFSETRFPHKKYHRISKLSITLLLCLTTSSSSQPTKKILAFLECLKTKGRISEVRCYHCS